MHKILSVAIVVIVVAGIWYYRSTHTTTATTYIAKAATIGNVKVTVSGTGQVSSSQELAVYPQVSGTVLTVNVKNGDTVTKGQVLATLDSTNAYYSLKNAQIALAKLETSNPISNKSDENTLANAQTSLNQAYQNAFNSISSTYSDMGPIITSLNAIFYNRNTSPYFTETNVGSVYGSTGLTYRQAAGVLLDQTTAEYNAFRNAYISADPTSTSTISANLAQELSIAQDLANTVRATAVAVNYIINQTSANSRPSTMTSDENSLSTWLSQVNQDNSSLSSAITSIQNAQQALTQAQANLAANQTTNSPLDLQSAQLSLAQAQTTYNNYTIRAPFSGVIGNVTLAPGDTAGGSTAIGTIVTKDYVSTIVLNEVDVAKVAIGQPVTTTFNALPGVTATGTVIDVDSVGTVSQGVVSYNVKISISTDNPVIKAGMSINTNIITSEADNVVVVPNSAIKTVGNRSYVLIPASSSAISANGSSVSATATGTRRYRSSTNTGSTTMSTSTLPYGGYASTTRSSSTPRYGNGNSTVPTVTVTAVTTQPVTIGLSDNVNTQIITGVNPGDLVITQTITGTAAAAATSNILSSLTGGTRGAGGGGTGGTFRPTTAAPTATGR